MIKINNLYKSFQDNPVLIDVSLEIMKNEIVALQGPSGAGKTTLLKSIGLLDSIDKGIILFENQKIQLYNETQKSKFRNQKIGFVFQFHNLLPEFSSLENICMPYLIYNKNYQEAEQKAFQLMKALNILDKKDSKPNELSGGEQQRVAIARALINSPKLILADEPTGSLDTLNAEKVLELLFDQVEETGSTLICATHSQDLASQFDRIYTVEDLR